MAGRRDRGMQEKLSRILAAASELFDERGFAAVTTQQISDRADVAAGTLFRYASTKGELLLMVYNERYRAVIEQGATRAAATSGADAVMAFVSPVIRWAEQHPENSTAYQRELMFGPAGERFRDEGLTLVGEFEDRISGILRAEHPAREQDASAAARTIFSVVHIAIARLAFHPHTAEDAAQLRQQIDQIITGFRAATRTEPQGKERQ